MVLAALEAAQKGDHCAATGVARRRVAGEDACRARTGAVPRRARGDQLVLT